MDFKFKQREDEINVKNVYLKIEFSSVNMENKDSILSRS